MALAFPDICRCHVAVQSLHWSRNVAVLVISLACGHEVNWIDLNNIEKKGKELLKVTLQAFAMLNDQRYGYG